MADTFSNDLRVRLQESGSNAGSWGDLLNGTITNLASALGQGSEAIPNASTHTITLADGTADEARSLYLKCTGGGQACTVTLGPNTISKVWIIDNATSYTLTFSQGSGANVAIAAGAVKVIATDGAGSGAAVVDTLDGLEGSLSSLAVTGALTVDTNTLVVDATNNRVGIGTSSPSTKLHLGGTAPGDSIIRQDSTGSGTNWEIGEREAGKWQIFEDDGDSVVATFASSGAATFKGDISAVGIQANQDASGTLGAISLYSARTDSATRNWAISTNSNVYGDFVIRQSNAKDGNPITAGTDRLSIAASGAVTLTANTTNDWALAVINGTNSNAFGLYINAPSTSAIPLRVDGGGSERMRLDSSGTMLVGTSSAIGGAGGSGAQLFVKQAVSSNGISSVANSNDHFVRMYHTGTIGKIESTYGTGSYTPLTLFTGGSERIRIDTSGRLLINTTSILSGSNAKLQVLQTVADHWSTRINNSTGSPYGLSIGYSSASPNSVDSHFLYFTDSTAVRFGVYSNGGVLNYSSNNVNLSDRNAKKDITIHTDNEWNCVKAWEIVDYRYKDEADDSPAKIGVIAQQIQEHCPDLVNVFQKQADAVEEVLGEDGEVVTEAKAAVEERIGVNEAQMMWKVTKALQEAMTRIETLEAKVQTLENN